MLYTKMPKATYMYWQKRFDRVNPDKEIEEKILEVRKNNKDYGYRRIYGALRNLGYIIQYIRKVKKVVKKLINGLKNLKKIQLYKMSKRLIIKNTKLQRKKLMKLYFMQFGVCNHLKKKAKKNIIFKNIQKSGC